jgi:precorrin-8X/cobalt-precorrin-8 methylmutase
MIRLEYERDGAAITRASFATIRAEADLSAVPADLEPVIVRMIHACGDVGIVPFVAASADLVPTARRALGAGRAIWCDSEMVAHGIARHRLPAANPVRCIVREPAVASLSPSSATPRRLSSDCWS